MPEERTFKARAALNGNSFRLSKVNQATATLALVDCSRVRPPACEGNFAARRARNQVTACPARLALQTRKPLCWRVLPWWQPWLRLGLAGAAVSLPRSFRGVHRSRQRL